MKIFEKGELKLLWPFYLERFISHLLYFAPAFWVLQFQQNFTLSQIGILFGILSISSFIFEIPTGAFADLYGRKKSSLLGYFLLAIITSMLYFNLNFYLLAVLFILWGLSLTFISGAKESWIVDSLKLNKKFHLLKDYYIKEQSIIKFSLFLSGFFGAFIVAKLGLNIIWIFAGLSYFISGLLLLFIKEIKTTKKSINFKIFFNQAKNSIKYCYKHHILFFLLSATFFIMFRDSFGGDLVWQPFLKDLGFPIYAFGFLFSAITLLGIFAPFLSKSILKLFKNEKNYLIFFLIVSFILDLLILFVFNYILAIIILVFMFLSIDLFMPIGSVYFQKHVVSKMRATITSLNGMIIALAYAISMPLSGFFADKIGPKYTIVLGSIFLLIAIFFYQKIKEEKK